MSRRVQRLCDPFDHPKTRHSCPSSRVLVLEEAPLRHLFLRTPRIVEVVGGSSRAPHRSKRLLLVDDWCPRHLYSLLLVPATRVLLQNRVSRLRLARGPCRPRSPLLRDPHQLLPIKITIIVPRVLSRDGWHARLFGPSRRRPLAAPCLDLPSIDLSPCPH
jgi:hypothetical protein